jgi:hypothetical protein
VESKPCQEMPHGIIASTPPVSGPQWAAISWRQPARLFPLIAKVYIPRPHRGRCLIYIPSVALTVFGSDERTVTVCAGGRTGCHSWLEPTLFYSCHHR